MRLPSAVLPAAVLLAAALSMILSVFSVPAFAADSLEAELGRHDPESTIRVDYEPWARFLADHLRADADGIHRVDYAEVTELEAKRLGAWVKTLAATDVTALSRDEQLAFWINLYNAATVAVVLEHHPVDSIRDIALPPAEAGGGPWDAPRVEVMGRALSLNDIEHRILRPIWNDPRLHYAVNCAALGCPNLAAVPYTGSRIDGLLDRAAAAFVNHPRAVRFERGKLVLSSLFDWYGEDFGDSRRELLEHLAEIAQEPMAGRLRAYEGDIDYAYDWSLNGF